MKYFSLSSIINSYDSISKSTKDKFWGILGILYSIEKTISPSLNYSLDTVKLSTFLENTFRLKNKKNYDETSSAYSVVFSDKWDEAIINNFIIGKPNIMPIVVWAYRRKAFDDNISLANIFEKFLNDFHLTKAVVEKIFNIDFISYPVEFDNFLYDEDNLLVSLGGSITSEATTIKLNRSFVVANAGDLSRGPFFQPLYAALNTLECLTLFPFVLSKYYTLFGEKQEILTTEKKCYQQIFYGAPGTGKSHIIKEQTKGEDVIRTTFHPDTDYSTFVGTYKPTTEFAPVLAIIGDKAVETGREEKRISYEFVCQAFLQAYVAAWKKVAEAKGSTAKKQFLVIEEINRGNCAQIFGDLFQLLDRNDYGYSDYPIQADADMQKQLKWLFGGVEIENAESINALYDGRDIVKEVLSGEVLLLPNNLYIWATMNTSDQSLFPIDSAFKRRWDWQYMPISEGRDKNGQSKNWKIEADTQMYSWWSFIQKINDEIYDKTNSEDKKLGYYFCKPINGVIKVETFVSKVLFYIWNDVFKDFDNESGIFAEPYDKFYGTDTKGDVVIAKDKVQTLLDNLNVEVAEIIGADENESVSDESDNATMTGSSARDKSVYSINGEGNYVKKTVPLATVNTFVKNYPDVTASELVETWYALGTMIRQIVISKESYEQKLSKTSDAIFAKRYDSLNLPNGDVVYVYNQFTPERINDFISKVNEQSWDIHIEKVAE